MIKSIIKKLFSPIIKKLPIYNQFVFKYCIVNSKGWKGSKFSINYLLRPGETLIIDNHRVLHGRKQFEGYRNMVGCYLN